MKHLTWIILSLTWGSQTAVANAQQPNILVILLDDVGVDSLAVYEDQYLASGVDLNYAKTPNIDQLRQGGILFSRAYAMPICGPTRACIQTGRYGFRTGMGSNPGGYDLPNSEVTIAELLRDGFGATSPYVCGAFGKWHLAEHSNTSHVTDNGYDIFEGFMTGVSTPGPGHHYYWDRVCAGTSTCTSGYVGIGLGVHDPAYYEATMTVESAKDWIANVPAGKSFFAYVCMQAPHDPWQVPPLNLLSNASQNVVSQLMLSEGDIVSDFPERQAVYRLMLEAVDTEIGNLLNSLTPGQKANTLVILMGDNGTAQEIIQLSLDSTHGKGTVYELGIQVPLIVSGGYVTQADTTCEELVHAVDLWSTIKDVTGATNGISLISDSISFKHLIDNPNDVGNRGHVFTQIFTPNGSYDPATSVKPHGKDEHLRSIMDINLKKYLRLWDDPIETELAFEIDVTLDPFETVDLFSSNPSWLPPLIAEMDALSGN